MSFWRLSERQVIFFDWWDISRSLVIDTRWKNERFYDSFESQINWRIRLMLAFRLTYATILISQINDNLFLFLFDEEKNFWYDEPHRTQFEIFKKSFLKQYVHFFVWCHQQSLIFKDENDCLILLLKETNDHLLIFRRCSSFSSWLCDSERISLSKTIVTDVSKEFSTWIEFVIKKKTKKKKGKSRLFFFSVVHIHWKFCQWMFVRTEKKRKAKQHRRIWWLQIKFEQLPS